MYQLLALAVVALCAAVLVRLNALYTPAGRRPGPGVLVTIAGLFGLGGCLYLGWESCPPVLELRPPGMAPGLGVRIVVMAVLPFDAMSLMAGAYYWRQLRPRHALPLLFAIGFPVYALVWHYL